MLFHQLSNFTQFTIKEEPSSLFYKEGNVYDGSINAYKIKDSRSEDILKPVTFTKNYEVQVKQNS